MKFNLGIIVLTMLVAMCMARSHHRRQVAPSVEERAGHLTTIEQPVRRDTQEATTESTPMVAVEHPQRLEQQQQHMPRRRRYVYYVEESASEELTGVKGRQEEGSSIPAAPVERQAEEREPETVTTIPPRYRRDEERVLEDILQPTGEPVHRPRHKRHHIGENNEGKHPVPATAEETLPREDDIEQQLTSVKPLRRYRHVGHENVPLTTQETIQQRRDIQEEEEVQQQTTLMPVRHRRHGHSGHVSVQPILQATTEETLVQQPREIQESEEEQQVQTTSQPVVPRRHRRHGQMVHEENVPLTTEQTIPRESREVQEESEELVQLTTPKPLRHRRNIGHENVAPLTTEETPMRLYRDASTSEEY